MIWVLVLCGVLWVLGGVFDRPRRERWILLAGIWVLAFFLFWVPGDFTSDHARVWVLVTVFASLGFGYVFVLQRVKQRVKVLLVKSNRVLTNQQEKKWQSKFWRRRRSRTMRILSASIVKSQF